MNLPLKPIFLIIIPTTKEVLGLVKLPLKILKNRAFREYMIIKIYINNLENRTQRDNSQEEKGDRII